MTKKVRNAITKVLGSLPRFNETERTQAGAALPFPVARKRLVIRAKNGAFFAVEAEPETLSFFGVRLDSENPTKEELGDINRWGIFFIILESSAGPCVISRSDAEHVASADGPRKVPCYPIRHIHSEVMEPRIAN